MRKLKNVVSFFDGASCGQEALNRAGVSYNKYYASEIDPDAVAVTMKNHPKTLQVGDIRDLDPNDFKNVDLVLAGFPCTDFSIMGNRKGMVTKENIDITSLDQYLDLKNSGFEFEGESYLLWELIRMTRGFGNVLFLFENVAKIEQKWLDIINREIGVEPIQINASRMTAQNRDRLYWTNIPQLEYPDDKGITLDHIIPGAVAAGKRGVLAKYATILSNKPNVKWHQKITKRKDGKANCLVTSGGGTNLYVLNGKLTQMTPEECEVLQTLTKGYTNVRGLSKSARYRIIGNGWSVDTVVPFFKSLTVDNRLK